MKPQIRLNLQPKVILTALILALAPLIILAMLDTRAARKNLTNVANQSLTIAAEQTANRIDQFLLENLLEIQATGQLSPFAQYLKLEPEMRSGSQEENDVSTIFRTLSRKNFFLPTPYALLDEGGMNVFDFEKWRIGSNESGKIYFRKPFQTGQPYISPILFSPDTNRQAFFYISGPVFNVAGNVVGVVRISLSTAFVQDFIANTSGLAGLESFGFLIDKNHFILAHSKNPEMVFRTSRRLTAPMIKQLQADGEIPQILKENLTIDLPDFEKKLKQSAGSTVFTTPLTPDKKQLNQVSVSRLKQTEWQVVVAQPQETFLKPIHKQIYNIQWLVSIIAVVVIFLAVIVSRQLTQPIIIMTTIARKISIGDLTARVPETSHDELGELARSFNDMAGQLRESIGLLQESEAKYRRLHESMADAYAAVNMDGQIIETNPAFLDLTGYSHDELTNKTYEELTPKKWHVPELRIIKEQVLKQDCSELFEKEYIKKDGSVIPVELRIFLLRDDDGQPQTQWAIVRDLTERKKTQAQFLQAQKMESVGQLAGGVAHDYNNLSSIIIGYTEMALEDSEPGSPLHANLMNVLTAANRCTDITRQLLAFASRQTIAPRVLDLNKTLDNMLSMFRRLIGENIDLTWMPGSKIWPVKMDPSQIDQIMANLCVNARDAIADVGKITVKTRNITFDRDYCDDHPGFVPGEYVLLAFSDNGCGIEPEILANIFEPFFTTKGVGEGTGLGMSTVYGIVKQNKGFINVYSEPQKGTTFRIYLSRHKGHAAEALLGNKLEAPLGTGETILLVEDDDSILQLAEKILKNLGYIVHAVARPLEAIKLTEKQAGEIDLLITDVVMPEMNGRELSNQVEKLNPNIKTLFMSGYMANIIAHQGILEDDVFFIPKPFSKNEIAVKIREVLDETKGTLHA